MGRMNILLNKFLYFKVIILVITILSASESEDNITQDQKKQIEALTNDMLMAPEFELNST